MLRYRWFALAVLVCLATPRGFADDEDAAVKNVKNVEARKALLRYEAAIAEAEKEFEQKRELALKELLASLEDAQENATKANKLDEALHIREAREALQSDAERAKSGGKVQIVAAFYGQHVNWIDVTEKARRAFRGKAKWSTVVDTRDWGEPAPGWAGTRTFLVRYLVNGKPMTKSVYQGQVITIP